jgi:hypothetical protein
MTRRIASGPFALAASLALAALTPAVLLAGSPNHTKQDIVENLDIVIPADEACSGEDVHVFGELDGVLQTTTDSRGGLHVILHLIPHLQAVGAMTGLEYQAVGPLNTVDFVDGSAPRVDVLVNIINLISPGSTDNLILSEKAHVTVNANGTVTVEFDELKGGCRG